MLPDHLEYWDPDRKEGSHNPPLLGAIDLLIVDEAGQVSPEVGALPLALARQALVVGDIHQIEPVWSLGAATDRANLKKEGLQINQDQIESSGALASNGSLMKLGRQASAFTREDEKGLFLAEHRRCRKAIIQVCNDLVYRDRLIPRGPEPSNPILPPLGWANVRSPSRAQGGSRANPGEAEAIGDWLCRRRQELEEYYHKALEKVVAILTPYSAQKGALRKSFEAHGISGSIISGTVHALQGAEKEIVILSPVHTIEDGSLPYFDVKPNLINVAVSRAKHSFLVFGDMRYSDPARRTRPCGVLARHLFSSPDAEICDVLSRPEFLEGSHRGNTTRLESLEAHRQTLREGISGASTRVLIVSPYISVVPIRHDQLDECIERARQRQVQVTVVFDPEQNKERRAFRATTDEGLALLRRAGAELREILRIHNKTLAVDDRWIVEGSFNWLSAARDPQALFARQERSLRYDGPLARNYCDKAWSELERPEWKPQ
jgi:AAA domain/PLD-like domain